MVNLPKVVVVVGPTGVGKSDLALTLAKEFKGEIISADSRQIYRRLNIGTGKPNGAWGEKDGEEVFLVDGIKHYGLDYIEPDQAYSVADFKKYCVEQLNNIIARGHLPIIVGGTGLYLSAVINNLALPNVAPNQSSRAKFECLDLVELLNLLKAADPRGYDFVDKKNKRRVVRALEIANNVGDSSIAQREQLPPAYQFLQVGLTLSRSDLNLKIDRRIDAQIAHGFLAEAQSLFKLYDSDLPSLSSVGYREWQRYLAGEFTITEVVKAIKNSTHQYAKRQMTWFKRDPRIRWFDPIEANAIAEEIEEFVKT